MKKLERASIGTALWSLGYALYRSYYALGRTVGMFGVPVSDAQWRRINAIAGVLLFATAALALVVPKLWQRAHARPWLLAFCWIATVGCVSHALIAIVQRIASLSGALRIEYPFWATIDRRTADLQDLLFNEPWFLIEGLLWAAVAWHATFDEPARRRRWFTSAGVATIASAVLGVLSAFGIIGKMIVG